MDSILAAARAGVVVSKAAVAAVVPTIEVKAPVEKGRYSIGDSDLSVEWNWVHAGWGLSSRDDYIKWEDDGPLHDPRRWDNRQERGRQLIIEHFGLERITDNLPLDVIAELSPAALFSLRRRLESDYAFPRKDDMISHRGGDHCSAEHCF